MVQRAQDHVARHSGTACCHWVQRRHTIITQECEYGTLVTSGTSADPSQAGHSVHEKGRTGPHAVQGKQEPHRKGRGSHSGTWRCGQMPQGRGGGEQGQLPQWPAGDPPPGPPQSREGSSANCPGPSTAAATQRAKRPRPKAGEGESANAQPLNWNRPIARSRATASPRNKMNSTPPDSPPPPQVWELLSGNKHAHKEVLGGGTPVS